MTWSFFKYFNFWTDFLWKKIEIASFRRWSDYDQRYVLMFERDIFIQIFIRSNVRQHVVALILAHNCGKNCNSTSSFFCAFLTHQQPAQWRLNGQIYHKRWLESKEITFGVFIIVALDHRSTFKIHLRLTGINKFNIVVKTKVFLPRSQPWYYHLYYHWSPLITSSSSCISWLSSWS